MELMELTLEHILTGLYSALQHKDSCRMKSRLFESLAHCPENANFSFPIPAFRYKFCRTFPKTYVIRNIKKKKPRFLCGFKLIIESLLETL